MNVTITREVLEKLLTYTEAEIETRYGCLKDAPVGDQSDCAGRAELEAEISEAQDILAAVRVIMKVQKHQPGTDIRHPTLKMGDKMGQLNTAVLSEPVLAEDEALGTILNELYVWYRRLVDHLNANYLWD